MLSCPANETDRKEEDLSNRLLAWLASVLALLMASGVAHAQDRQPGSVMDPAELGAFLDGLITSQREAYHIAGAALVVVKDGLVFVLRGYGWSDVAKRVEVDPARTMFRIGSVTKLFVWTAVMQLVEEGKLDLDTDVNRYLGDLRLPATYPEPITMRHLMTHTAGFEDNVIGLFARTPDDLRPLKEVLAERMPARIRRPGQLAAYSNYGAALAGYVVAQVSGMPWEDYVGERILVPLGMGDTTMKQPLPAPLQGQMSNGYGWGSGRFHAKPFELVPLAPAGGGSSSATDMARFMTAHLQGGRLGSARVLETSTAERMHETAFTHDPRIGGMLYGFYDLRRSPVHAYGHGGDTFFFHSLLLFIPEQRLGLFVSYNSELGGDARKALTDAFFDRYFPAAPLTPIPAGAEQRVHEVEGEYASTRQAATSIAKIAAVFQSIEVRATTVGRITVTGPWSGPLWMVEQEPYLFRETLGDRVLVFRKGADGEVTHAFFDHAPMVAFERAPMRETRWVQALVVGFTLTAFASALVASIVGWWRRRRVREKQNGVTAAAWASTWCFSALFIAFAIVTVTVLSDKDQIAFGVPMVMRAALWLPVLAAPVWLLAAVLTLAAWWAGCWRLPARLHRTLVVAAGAVFLVWLAHWNLLG